MAEGGSDEIIDKHVCGLCLETYMKEPKLISCFHSFCLICLEEYVKDNLQDSTFRCPLCSESTELPKGGVKNFETNVYIDNELLSNIKHHCDICGPDVDATNHCVECNENYCVKCTEVHTKMKLSRAHSLISIEITGDKQIAPIMKTSYCEKHPKEELKVICKDCDKMLCLVCKLTDHEKHTSTDISDEAKTVKESIQKKIREMYENISTLEDVDKRQRATERDAGKRKDRELDKLKQYKKMLETLIAKRMQNTEEFIAKTFDSVCAEMSSSVKETKKNLLSLRNWVLQIDKMMTLSDKVSGIEHSRTLEHLITKYAKRMDYYSKVNPENSLEQCKFSLTETFFVNTFSPVFMKETVKEVSKISECKLKYSDLNYCCSLSIFQYSCTASFLDSLGKADSPSYFVNMELTDLKSELGRSVCVVKGKCYYTAQNSKELKVWKRKVKHLKLSRVSTCIL